MTIVKKTLRLEEGLLQDIQGVAKEEGKTETQIFTEALKLYRDYHYLQNKACFINEQLLDVLQGTLKLVQQSINQKTNQVLSEVAVQSAIQNQILASSLEVSQKETHLYRIRALEFLKEQNRVLRLDELKHE